MNRNMRGWMYVIFAVLIMCITLGYAYLNTELDINGTTNITSANWSIYWDNIQLGSNNVTDITTPATISSGLTEVTFNVNFSQPGDTYEFTVDAVNDGSINAMVSVVSNGVFAANGTTPKTLPDYLEYSVTYSDGVAIAQNHLLEAGDTETYKVRVHYKEDISSSQLPSTNDNYVFKFSVTYAQATSSAVERPGPDFTTDSWETIINNARNNPGVYELGDTKTVDMGTFGTHTLRIANTTTPAECSTEGFSQTACGFVLEFADIITTHNMNSTDTNVGGWPANELRTYVSTDIYNALPEVIRNAIVNTTVVSGHGSTTGETNFTSTDKLYLLSTHEVWEDTDGNTSNGIDYYDTSYNNTRQLDYYANLGLTVGAYNSSTFSYDGNYSRAIKQRNGSNYNWWLRSAYSSNTGNFHIVIIYGYWRSNYATDTYGVSPAFRLG